MTTASGTVQLVCGAVKGTLQCSQVRQDGSTTDLRADMLLWHLSRRLSERVFGCFRGIYAPFHGPSKPANQEYSSNSSGTVGVDLCKRRPSQLSKGICTVSRYKGFSRQQSVTSRLHEAEHHCAAYYCGPSLHRRHGTIWPGREQTCSRTRSELARAASLASVSAALRVLPHSYFWPHLCRRPRMTIEALDGAVAIPTTFWVVMRSAF